jgi:hypothetical protein
MTMQSKLRCGFRGTMQLPLFMIWREFYLLGDVVYAEPVFTIWGPLSFYRRFLALMKR